MSHNNLATSLCLVALAVMSGCSSRARNGPAGATLTFAVSSRPAPGREPKGAVFQGPSHCTPTVSAAANAIAISCGGDVLVLWKASVVVRKIELERAAVAPCDEGADDGECEEFEIGPIRFDLPLGVTNVAPVVTVDGLAPGTYDNLEFEIHRPSTVEDAVFVLRNRDLVGVSIRVEGSFSRGGAPAPTFVYTSDLEREQKEHMPLEVSGAGSVGVTLRLDVADWFFADGGLIDPRTANEDGPYERAVRDNIRQSVRAFRDDDQDGLADHGGVSARI